MNKLILEVDVKVVTESIKKEIPLPLYLRIDYGEYLHIDENEVCCYVYYDTEDESAVVMGAYKQDYTSLEPSKKTYIDRWLKQYEDYTCSKEEFKMFKKSLVEDL